MWMFEKISDLKVIVFMQPLASLYCSTFVCPTEIIAFSDRVGEFKKINTEVIACSVDSQFTHLAWWGPQGQPLLQTKLDI